MGKFKIKFQKIVSSVVAIGMISGISAEAQAATTSVGRAQIIVDYNTSIGTGSKYIFGGAGTPAHDELAAWSSLNTDMGVSLIKLPVDLAKLYPTSDGVVDTNVKEEYLHVASGQLTRARGAKMDVMLEFVNIPEWLDVDNNKKYDDVEKYTTMIKEFLKDASDYNDIVKFIEIAPSESLNEADFVDVYYDTAKAVRSLGPNYKIGGNGYILRSKSDSSLGKIQGLLKRYKTEEDKSLLQFISVRAYSVNATNDEYDYFGEFKEGRKSIRNWSDNADLPIFMTGWTTVSKDSTSPDRNINTEAGIQQQATALFKAMRDGWNTVLFNSTTSNKVSSATYTYSISDDGNIVLNPFAKTWNLLSNKLKLGKGDFKVVSTDMGSRWPVDDSIAMINSEGEVIILATNFSSEKNNITLELKNVPYKDGDIELECYVAKEGVNSDKPYVKVPAKVINGIINATIPSIPSNGATGIVVKGGVNKTLPAQTIYEFESQDNHFGGNTEITWKTGASFNRVVKNFNGINNFVTLKKVSADGSGTYTARLYGATGNGTVKISVNEEEAISVNASSISLNKPVEFDINLKAGNNNTIKVWTESGELNPDKMVLIAKDIKLSIGFQNLNKLATDGAGENLRYILPLEKKDFVIDGRIFPENVADSNTLEYTSSNPEIVTVNNTGLLTPVTTGEAIIKANIIGNKDITSSFKLVVKNAVAGISVNPKTISLRKGQTSTITAKVLPENAENKNITWSTSNSDVVEIVSSNNDKAEIKVIGNSGSALITAKAVDGGYYDSSSITVVNPENGGDIEIDYGNTITNGSPNIFGVTHYPSINKTDNDIGDHSKVWEMLRDDMGVKFMRADARLQEILPIWTKTPNTNWSENSDVKPGQPTYVEADYYYVTGPDGVKRQFTVEGYKEDMEYYKKNGKYLNGMSNPENWNTERLMNWVKKAKEMDFQVMVMTFQIPEWLASGYPLPNAPHTEKAANSAPKDWDIFRDIIKKVYIMVKPYADYYELLNEPHWYVPKGGDQRRPDGTAYPSSNKVNLIASDTMYQAIDAMYEAERELTGDINANPTMKLGGGSDDSWGGEYGVLGTLFSDQFAKWHDRVEFVSIHKYGERPANQNLSNDGANSRNLKYWLREKTGKDMPIFLNEYNASTGQPHEYHTGAKSMSYHGRNLIDMMIDEYSGGGYYTTYPSDVPMDDYEASKGWVERGKGVYAWNNGSPKLATFTKTWNLLSKKLGLGNGEFKVKSTNVRNSKISDGIAAININGNPVAFITNYSNKLYADVSLKMSNVPYEVGSDITAKIYSMTTESSIDMKPEIKVIKVKEDGSADVKIDVVGANGVVGVILEGKAIEKKDKTIEFESYLNSLNGNVKIETENLASNGRWLSKISEGESNSVSVSINSNETGKYLTILSYQNDKDITLNYKINNGKDNSIKLPKTTGIQTKVIEIPVVKGTNKVTFYTKEQSSLKLDKLEIGEFKGDEEGAPSLNKEELQKLLDDNKDKIEEDYTEKSWVIFREALINAEKILGNKDVTQTEVDNATINLKNAINNLEKKPEESNVDKSTLKNVIEENKNKVKDQYTEESWMVFENALKTAMSVLENKDVTQTEVDNSVRILTEATKGLVRKPTLPPVVDQNDLINLVDKETNIKIETQQDILPNETSMIVTPIKDGDTFTMVKDSLKDISNKFEVYDITLMVNELKIQPNGTVKVTIPIPNGYKKKNLEIYHISENGVKTKLDYTISEENIVFTTNHFSLYVIADTTRNSDSNTNNGNSNENNDNIANNNNNSNTNKLPNTGGQNTNVIIVVGILLAVAGIVCITKKSKKIKE